MKYRGVETSFGRGFYQKHKTTVLVTFPYMRAPPLPCFTNIRYNSVITVKPFVCRQMYIFWCLDTKLSLNLTT